MTRQSVLINDIDDIIKIFLYSCHNFDITFGYSDDDVPFWYKKSNFVLLLNLPNQIRVFRPVYFHWEGVKERYIKYAKPMLQNKRQSVTYLCTKFQQILQNNAIDIQNMRYKRSSARQYHCHKNIIVFPTKDVLEDRIKSHESFPVIIKKSYPLLCWVLYKQNNMYGYYNIQFNDDIGIHKCNLWFSKLKINKYVNDKFDTIDEIYNKHDET